MTRSAGFAVGLFLCPIAGNAAENPAPAIQTTGEQPASGGLDFERIEVPPEAVQVVTKKGEEKGTPGAIALSALLAAVVGGAALWGHWAPRGDSRVLLQDAPLSGKLALTLLLTLYGSSHVLAAITGHIDTRHVYETTAEYFFYMTQGRLSGLSHAHLMGIATMDGIVALLFAYSRPSSAFAAGVVTLAFVGIAGDVGSWWLIKYAGGGYELVAIVSGTFLAAGFSVMAIALFRDTWFGRTKAKSPRKGSTS